MSSPKSHFSTAIALLVPAGLLVAVSIYLGSQYPLPTAGSAAYGAGAYNSSLYWVVDTYEQDEAMFALDLETGKVSRVPFRAARHLGIRNSKGQRIRLTHSLSTGDALEIIDDQTGQLIASAKTSEGRPMLVGEDYLVSVFPNRFIVEKFQLTTSSGQATIELEKHTCFIENPPSPTAEVGLHLQAIEGTNRFLYHSHRNNPPTIRVYEIVGGEIMELGRWTTTAKSAMVQYAGWIMSASQDGMSVDVRDLKTLELRETRALPAGLKGWEFDLSRGILTKNDLFSFVDSKAGVTRVHRLDDFSVIPELDTLVALGGVKSDKGDFRRYVMLTDGMYRQRPLTVYDSVKRRIAYRGLPPDGVEEMRIVDHYLVYATSESGLTVEMYDLERGVLAKRLQPFAWIVWSVPVILCLALVWALIWIQASSRWLGYGWLSILIMAILFVTPQLVHAIQFNNSYILRPAVGFSGCILMVLLFGLALYIVYGSHRLLLRTVPLWLYMAAVLGMVNLLANSSGITNGATSLHSYPAHSARGLSSLQPMRANTIVFFVFFPVVAVLVLTMLRMVRWLMLEQARVLGRLRTPVQASRPRDAQNTARRPMMLQDIFVVTACIAAFAATCAPNSSFLLVSEAMLIVGILASVSCMPLLLGMAGLSRSPAVLRSFPILMLALAVLLIAEFTAHLLFGQYHRAIWFQLLNVVRYAVFMVVSMYAFCYVWSRAQRPSTVS